ncbi:MAG: hypothetical protein KJ709_09415, partial [Nanoarchaeota archaeon]|nr:hypothetical protein [Nanoarchaeota archaeon]
LLTKKQLEISICSCELQDLILTLLSSSDWKSPVLEDPEKWLAINPHRYDIISPHGKFIHERISPERENAPMLEIVLFCQTHFRPGARQKTIALLPMHHDHIFQAGKTLIESQKFDFLGIEGYTGAYEIMQGVLNTTFCDGSPLNCATYILEESDWFSIRAGEKLEHEFKWRLNTYGIDDYEKAGLLPEEERDRIESKFAQIYFDYAIYRQKYELGLASGENLQDKAQRVLNNCRVIFEQYYKLLIERGLSAARVAIHHMIEKNLYKGLIVFGGLHFLQFKEIFDRFIDDEGLRKKLVTEANGNPKTTLSYWIFLPHNS